MIYLCEIFNREGKIIEKRYITVSVGDVSDATKNEKVLALKKKAQNMGFGFRVQRME